MVVSRKNPQKIASGIGRVVRTAYRPLTRVAPLKNGNKNTFAPIPGEVPIVALRVQVMCCEELLAKDRNGSSDPFVVISLLGTRNQTPVIRRSTNPVWSAKDATFDIPIYLSLADKLGALELVIWDKDMLKKDYLGECALPLEDWFKPPVFGFDEPENEPMTFPIVSTRANTSASGSIRVKLGFVNIPGVANIAQFSETYEELIRRSRPSLVSAPPTEGIGTIRSHHVGPEFEDDGLTSEDEEDEDYEGEEEDIVPPMQQQRKTSAPSGPTILAPTPEPASAASPRLSPVIKPPSPGIKILPKILRRKTGDSTDSTTPSLSPTPPPQPMSSPPTPQPGKKNRVRRSWAAKPGEYEYNDPESKDVVGIVMLEVKSAEDLPKLKNMTRTGWDMDPFVVISFSKKVFRTRVIRHCLNPVWDEKLLFHVRKYETAFSVQLSVLDWDKISSNDRVGETSFHLGQLTANVPEKDPKTGLYPEVEDENRTFQEFTLPLQNSTNTIWDAKHKPTITVRAKYQPYDALRQRFWYQIIKQYDTDDTRTLSHLELTSMLDSLGSTLSAETISSFWTRNNKSIANEDELTFEEAIIALEEEIARPTAEKKRIDPRDNDKELGMNTSTAGTPNPSGSEAQFMHALEGLSFAGPGLHVPTSDESSLKMSRPQHETEGMQTVIGSVEHRAEQLIPHLHNGLPKEPPSTPASSSSTSSSSATPTSSTAASSTTSASATPPSSQPTTPRPQQSASSSDADESGSSSPGSEMYVERVINVKNCPLCHRPRMNKRAERDIVTHLAVCASSDWNRVDRMLVGNFVTASQAQRKWYTRIFSKGLSGDYKLGANSANIIVQNRLTGQLEEEKMQVYVRLGIRLLYKGASRRLEGARARRLLKSMSIKQGVKYDSPASVADIRPFIDFHNLNLDEIELPLQDYKTFNQFFYRKLKPEARPVEVPDDPNRLVSSADCRLMAFDSVNEATKLWIKGREFSVARLLGDAYKDQADRYNGGHLVIFRLAPQDYHRFHSPVDGTIGPMTYISGEYYTVNPQAIRTTLDVYGENCRKIVPIDSPQFGRVMAVCIGAMMVGSIVTTVNEGDQVKRGQEFGYFAFGGSTIVMLFEPGVIHWDEDLVINGRASLETLVRVGMGIGWRKGTKPPNVK